ncbi:SDR family NAD(P)-dependent oxidoreductase [Vibrio fluvialis]|uniref:SDR family NAD(P)-dependent oxidoreductase n=1 Tax=Vibrio fluvialis TaxID=676 RepID=UPI001EE9FD5F|nr:SDR family oxidoreductase [Vibrio fluvialis]MCG6349095.1 SDR family oxidoreductase [Vibrio fluvialis]
MSQVILITGTRKGIGKYLAEYYLDKGHRVVGCSRGKASISCEGYEHFELDVSDEKAVVSMMRRVKKDYGTVDVLINNAGVAGMNHFLTTPLSNVENIYNTNVIGTYLFMREAAKIMMRKGKGKIINYSTVAVALNLEGEAAYASSKAAVESLTKIAAKELGPFGIQVNAIAPTPVYTDLIKTVPKDKINKLLESQIIKRFGEFTDVSNVIDFYISPNSGFITAQTIYLGGVVR